MNTDAIEKIEQYIEKTKLSTKITNNYCLYHTDMCAFLEEMNRDWCYAMRMIFAYGRAKGYRAAKAEARK